MDKIIMLGVTVLFLGVAQTFKHEKIKRLEEEIKHERFNHNAQLNINLGLIRENEMLKRQYNSMVQENLKLHRDFGEVLKK